MHDPQTLVAAIPPYVWTRRKDGSLGRPILRPIFEVWHHDPSGYDSETCGRDFRKLSHWRHWRVRFIPARNLTRRLFQRCAWCGGWSTKRNPVDVSHQSSDRQDRARWWQSRPDVYHRECSGAASGRERRVFEYARRRGYQEGVADGYRKRLDDLEKAAAL